MPTEQTPNLVDHEQRLSAVERRQDAYDNRMDSIIRDIAAVRAECSQQAITTTHAIDRISTQIADLIRQFAELTGAQRQDTEIRERTLILAQTKLANWKRWIAVFGLIVTVLGMIGSVLFSWQEVASYIWVNILHWKEPWSNLQ